MHLSLRCLLLCLSLNPVAMAGSIAIELRDTETGAYLQGDVTLQSNAAQSNAQAPATTRRLAVDGHAALALDAGDWWMEASSPAHHSLTSRLDSRAHAPGALQLWLEPKAARAFPMEEPGRAVYEGFVYQPDGAAAFDAEVRLGHSAARTDHSGRFQLSVVLSDALPDDGLLHTLRVEHGVQQSQRVLRVVPGVHRLIVDLGRGDSGVPDHRFDLDIIQQSGLLETDAGEVQPHAPIRTPPTSVRVGFSDAAFSTPCCVGSCNAVAVLPLETYVKRGLNDEWIASWRADALRAGAIAYRSYGAWHVDNPRTTSYDVCSSACCQVNDADTSASTNAAVDATAGILLERNGGIFRSEYSAENNSWDDPNDGLSCSNVDLSCGDGAVGSPSANWPCLADSVASGRGCFGHGRGMSQWGSQRWADLQGQRWPWIVDHYYNASGSGSGLRTSIMSSPLRIDSVSPFPATAMPGQRLQLQFELFNLAAQIHASVFLGASLFRSGYGYVSDPPNDAEVSLATGASLHSRDFDLPIDLPSGSYDLLVALYLDIDANGAINSGDFPLVSTTSSNAVEIIAPIDALFADGFESP